MRRLLPFPFLSGSLLIAWLLLNQTTAPGQVLLGCGLALLGPWILTLLQPPKGRIRRPGAIARLCWRVLLDIVRSNIAVARIILRPRPRDRTPGFVNIPLDLQDPYGLAVLACIITATPGTLWVNHDPATRVLMIHVLDLIEEGDWIRTIKNRYERLLQEIFE
ncbi:MAG: Na+/H+ antiporter subunit E [Dongiaceae bacterium]